MAHVVRKVKRVIQVFQLLEKKVIKVNLVHQAQAMLILQNTEEIITIEVNKVIREIKEIEYNKTYKFSNLIILTNFLFILIRVR